MSLLLFICSIFIDKFVYTLFQMESTIKQAEEGRNRGLDSAKELYEEYRPLKDELDVLRDRIGLEPLNDILDEDSKLTPQSV